MIKIVIKKGCFSVFKFHLIKCSRYKYEDLAFSLENGYLAFSLENGFASTKKRSVIWNIT